MTPLTPDFFVALENRLESALSTSSDPERSLCWCDGVKLPIGAQPSAKTMHDSRSVTLHAYFGKNGSDNWNMIVHLGNKSISRLARGLDLTPCIPDDNSDEWIELDFKRRVGEIYMK